MNPGAIGTSQPADSQAFALVHFAGGNDVRDPESAGLGSSPPEPLPRQPHELEITGGISRTGGTLRLHYRLDGALEDVVLPACLQAPERRDGLWEATCFEAFLAVAGEEGYWEVNLSPAGHWNVYRLDGYRRGLRPEPAFTTLPFAVRRQGRLLELDLACALPAAIGPDGPLEVGISAVIERMDGGVSHWALRHPGPLADFHRRDGFLLKL